MKIDTGLGSAQRIFEEFIEPVDYAKPSRKELKKTGQLELKLEKVETITAIPNLRCLEKLGVANNVSVLKGLIKEKEAFDSFILTKAFCERLDMLDRCELYKNPLKKPDRQLKALKDNPPPRVPKPGLYQ